MRKIIQKIKGSIYIKIAITIIISVILINFLVGAFFRHFMMKSRGDQFLNNISFYSELIVKELGSSPDINKIHEIEKNTGFSITIKNPETSIDFKTNEIISNADYKRINSNQKIGFYKGCIISNIKNGNMNYYFIQEEPMRKHKFTQTFIYMLLLITIVLIATFVFIRNFLKQLKSLSKGILETSSGNLKYKVPVTGNDELSQLSVSFNRMNEKIYEMMETRNRLLLDVSHELRTPVTRIKLATELMPDSPEKISIKDDLIEIEQMTESILNSARISKMNEKLICDSFCINNLLREVVKRYDNPRLKLKTPDNSYTIYADREKISIVLKNLIDNALKYSAEKNLPVEVEAFKADESIIIKVTDIGVGIDESEITKIFEPFYRSDKSRSRDTGGFGLGLSICKRIIEAHNGSINAESFKGKTTFTVKFASQKQN